MKYDRITDNSDAPVERRRPVTKVGLKEGYDIKRKVNRNHSRSTYQSTSRVVTRPSHVIVTRSRTPSPIPEESTEKMSLPPESSPSHISIPSEYQPDVNETPESTLLSFPSNYHSSVRASAMCRSSEDHFSRRITPLGIYEPKDRMKQERQFANVVLELIKRKAFDEKKNETPNETPEESVSKTQSQPPERKASVADQIRPPPAHVRPTLRLTNPDRLMSFADSLEDDRENRNAPRTPANVRGNRSLLHKVGVFLSFQ